MNRNTALLAIVATLAVSLRAAAQDYPSLAPIGSFRELLDLRSIATLKPWRTLQASSFDRRGGYYDSGHFLRIDAGRQLVLLDVEGPGCIDRMWFTRKKPRQEPFDLLLFVDDAPNPVLRADLYELLSGKRSPFLAPLAGTCGLKDTPGLYSYVPIGFARRCKLVLVPTAPDDQYQWRTTESGERIRHVYYQITYRKLPRATPVFGFRADLPREQSEALEQLRSLWSNAGRSPWPQEQRVTQSSSVVVGGSRPPAEMNLPGPGVIHALRLAVHPVGSAPLTEAIREASQLEITWDGAANPQIAVPLAAFFAAPNDRVEVRGIWSGCTKGRYYNYLPMPFARSALIRVSNPDPVRVDLEVSYREGAIRALDGRLAACRYDVAAPKQGEDYSILDQRGRGHVVALIMDRPGHMEGDDRWFVDGETEPSIHGTGTEDFFNFAWGLGGAEALPFHGITQHFGRPVCYRYLLPAGVPYEKSLRVTCEHGHDWPDGPNLHRGRYSGVVLLYAAEPVGSAAPASTKEK